MLAFLTQKTFAPLVLRLALAVIFILHGIQKVNAEKSWGTNWDESGKMPVMVQVPVAYGELLGGIALAFGFLTRLAALGISAIMAGAIALVHGQNGFYLHDGGFEYNFAIVAICLAVMLLGPGPLSLDRLLFPPKKKGAEK